MIIPSFTIPVYGIMILLSLVVGSIFHYSFLKKKGMPTQHIGLLLVLMIPFSTYGGVMFHYIASRGSSLGLSSYGGAIGTLVAAIIFSKMTGEKKVYIQSAVMSLPLIYAIGKVGCFFVGCCYGIPYDGILSVRYIDGLNIPLFPVQLAETLCFLIIFVAGCLIKEHPYKIEIIVILCAFFKFVLDYLRYSHIGVFLSLNQIVSLVVFMVGIGSTFYKCVISKDKA